MKTQNAIFAAFTAIVAVIIFCAAPVVADTGNGDLMKREDVTRKILDNGMTVLVKEDHAAPVATVNVWVKTGYFNEADQWTGISHLLEHMFFKGTERRPVGKIQDEVKSVGGYWNAGTIYDHTNYYIVVPSGEILRAMDIEADALLNSTFPQEELDKEQEVVIQEILRKYDRPDAMTWEKMIALSFKNHHIGRWRMGSPEQVRAMDREVTVKYYSDNYRPENIVLVVVGDVNTKEILSEAEKLFGIMPRGELNRFTSPAETEQKELRYGIDKSDITQAYATLGFHAPHALHEDEYAVSVLADLLGNGISSRLYRELKERSGIVNTISAGHYSLPDVGVFYIEAELEPDKLDEARNAIFAEIEKIKLRAPEPYELEKIKTALEFGLLSSLEEVGGQSTTLAYYESLGDYNLLNEYVEKLRAVTPEDVRKAAIKYLTPEKCSLQEMVPMNYDSPSRTAEEIYSGINKFLSNFTYDAPESAAVRIPTAKVVTDVKDMASNGALEITTLSNGMKLVVVERPRLPLVSMGIFFEGGQSFEEKTTAGISKLALSVSLKGTATHSAEELQDIAALLGVAIGADAYNDYSAYLMSCLSRNMPAALELIADVIINPSFPAEEIEKERQSQLARILKTKDSMYAYPLSLARQTAFPDHSYGLPGEGFNETVSAFSRDALVAAHRRLTSGAPFVIVVGDVKKSSVIAMMEESFGNFELKNEMGSAAKSPEFKGGEVVEERMKSQSAQAFAFPAVPAGSEITPALNILRNIASGMGGRLYDEVREKNNLAYTVTASLSLNKNGGLLISYAATLPENEERARTLMLEVWKSLAAGVISEEEFVNSVNYTVGIHKISLQGNADFRDQMARNYFMGRGLDYLEKFPALVESVTIEKLKEVAAEYLYPGEMALGVIRAKEQNASQ